ARFAEVMDMCRRYGDEFHLAVAHINRLVLWMKRGDVDGAVADLEECVRLSRRLGNAQIERPATFNLAELLYFAGQHERALPLARRSRDMQLRFVREPVYDDALLPARILWRTDAAEARAFLAWLEVHGDRAAWPPRAHVLAAMMDLVMDALARGRMDRTAWTELALRAAAHAPRDEHREVVTTAVELACHLGALDDARAWLAQARTPAGT